MIYTARPYGVKVRFAWTQRRADNLCKKHGVTAPDGCVGFTAWAPDGSIIMAVLDGERATLAHECTHTALYIMEHVGIDPCATNGEPMAYLLENLYAACDKAMS